MTQPTEQNSKGTAGGVLEVSFFTKLQAFRPATLLKRDFYTSVFL